MAYIANIYSNKSAVKLIDGLYNIFFKYIIQ